MISIIAAIGKNRELGKDGGLCFKIPEDMAYFKKTTEGHAVVMGSATFDSLPKALPARVNYVLTRSDREFPGAKVLHSVEEVLDLASSGECVGWGCPCGGKCGACPNEAEVFCIGGGKVYEQFLPYAQKLYLTEIDANCDADVFFPEFDASKYDRTVLEEGESEDLKYKFVVYTLIDTPASDSAANPSSDPTPDSAANPSPSAEAPMV